MGKNITFLKGFKERDHTRLLQRGEGKVPAAVDSVWRKVFKGFVRISTCPHFLTATTWKVKEL